MFKRLFLAVGRVRVGYKECRGLMQVYSVGDKGNITRLRMC